MYLNCFISILIIIQTVMVLCWGIHVEKWHNLDEYQVVFIEPNYKYNWFEAANECSLKNMSLIIIDSSDKSDAVTDLLRGIFHKSRNLWIDGNDLAVEGSFVWHLTGKPFEFTNWAKRPDNYRGGEDCVHIHGNSNYEWNDGNCAQKMGFICERNDRNDN